MFNPAVNSSLNPVLPTPERSDVQVLLGWHCCFLWTTEKWWTQLIGWFRTTECWFMAVGSRKVVTGHWRPEWRGCLSWIACGVMWYQCEISLANILIFSQEPTSAPPATVGVRSCAWPILEVGGVHVGVASLPSIPLPVHSCPAAPLERNLALMAASASTAADSAMGAWTVQTSRMNWAVSLKSCQVCVYQDAHEMWQQKNLFHCITNIPPDCLQVQTQTLLLDGDSVRNTLRRFPPRLTSTAGRTRFFQTRCHVPPSAATATAPVSQREPAWAVCARTATEESSANTAGVRGVTLPRSWRSSSSSSCWWLLLLFSLKGAEDKRAAVCSEPAAKMWLGL